jgi:hypothetical protein
VLSDRHVVGGYVEGILEDRLRWESREFSRSARGVATFWVVLSGETYINIANGSATSHLCGIGGGEEVVVGKIDWESWA